MQIQNRQETPFAQKIVIALSTKKALILSIVCILVFRFVFVITYPLNVGGDGSNYYNMIIAGKSNLLHAAGYPFLFKFLYRIILRLPVASPEELMLVLQHAVDLFILLAIMLVLAKRFGTLAAIASGFFYGLDAILIGEVSATRPGWFQGGLIALALITALEAFFAEDEKRKFIFYLLSSLLCIWSILVKLLSVSFLLIYVFLLSFESIRWKKRILYTVGISLVIILNYLLFVYTYQLPTSGSPALTHDKAWILWEKTLMFSPNHKIDPENGLQTKRFLLINNDFPQGEHGYIPYNQALQKVGLPPLERAPLVPSKVFSHLNAIPKSIRQPYQQRYAEIMTWDEEEIDAAFRQVKMPNRYNGNHHLSSYYIGLKETDSLLQGVFFEAISAYPFQYIVNVLTGILDSFAVSRDIPRFPVYVTPGEQTTKIGIHQENIEKSYSWGRVRYSIDGGRGLMYHVPILWEPGVAFFTRWHHLSPPALSKWLLSLGTLGICLYFSTIKKIWKEASLYVILIAFFMLSYVGTVNMLYWFRPKDLRIIEIFLCALSGIFISWIVHVFSNRPLPGLS